MVRVLAKTGDPTCIRVSSVDYPTAKGFATDNGELAILADEIATQPIAIYAPECWERVELVEPPKAVN